MRRTSTLLLSLLVTAASIVGVQASGVVAPFAWPIIEDGTATGLSVVESIGGIEAFSHLFIWQGGAEVPCDGLADSYCGMFPKSTLGMVRILPPCASTDASDECVASLAVTSNGVTKESTFIRAISAPSWSADSTTGLISGATDSLWSNPFSTDPNSGFQVHPFAYYLNQTPDPLKSEWQMKNFSTEVNPYLSVKGAYEPIKIQKKSTLSSWSGDFKGDWAYQSPPRECLWIDTNECGVRTDFGNISSVTLNMHLAKNQSGWLSGRLVNPDVSVSSFNAKENLFSVTASPAETAYVQAWTRSPTSSMNAFAGKYAGGLFVSWRIDVVSEFLKTYKDFLHDTVTKIIPTWSISDGFGTPTNPCLKSTDSFIGVVSTNATTYQADPPDFTDGSLNYAVGSLHYKPDGTLNKGTYDLLLNSAAARCLYNFTNAPIKAAIEVTTADGSEDVATTTTNEKNGWLHLNASGFTFSNPTIKVTLSQEALPEATPSPTPITSVVTIPSVAKPAAKKSTIICVKGLTLKKITSLKPTCPKGYRKR